MSAASSRGRISAKCVLLAAAALFATGAAQAALPAEYEQLAYVEGTDSTYVDTGLKATVNLRVVCRQQFTRGRGQCGWGSSGNKECFLWGNDDNLNLTACVDSSWGNRVSFVSPNDGAVHVFDLCGTNYVFDGAAVKKTGGYKTTSLAKNMYLFAYCAEWTSSPVRCCDGMRLYSCQFYDGETLVRDFVPAQRLSDGENGLYDLVESAFYVASGGDLAAGYLPSVVVEGSPARYGAPSPGYGRIKDTVAGTSYTFSVPQPVVTNDELTVESTCTGWTLVDPEGVVTSGEELSKTFTYTGGIYTLTWNWRDRKAFYGRTWHVETTGSDEAAGDETHPFATISNGLAHAENGDTVLVGAGIYELADELAVTNAVALKSVGGADATWVVRTNGHCVLDRSQSLSVASGCRRVLRLDSASACVDGFAFSGGTVWNTNGLHGGGVLIGVKGGTLANCTVTNNFCRKPSYGGGVAVTGADGVVTNCLVANNYNYRWSSSDDGGRGAGVYVTDGLVADSVISNNGHYAVYGAGAYMTGGRFSRCRVTKNVAGSGNFKFAGGLYLNGSSAIVENCLINGNTSQGAGGGVYGENGTLANCTIVGNTGTTGGGVNASSSVNVYNCILSGNKTTGDTGKGAPEWYGESATYRHCLSSVAFPSGSTGCFAGEAGFADAAAGDYTLTASSDAVDAGLDDVPDVAQELDLRRANRYCGTIDMGCYEHQYSGLLIAIAQSGDDQTTRAAMTLTAKARIATEETLSYRWNFGDGWSDWSESDTCTHLFAATGDQNFSVQVKAGETEYEASSVSAHVYPEEVRVELDGSGDYTDVPAALKVAGNGTVVRVGVGTFDFTGMLTVDKAITLRGAGAEKTVLHRTDGDCVKGEANRVLSINAAKAVVRGVAVTGGYVYGAAGEYGGGVQIGTKGGLLCDSIVTNNSGRTGSWGGGVALVGETAVVSNCLIASNYGRRYSASDGETCAGGVYLMNGLVTHCVISNNSCGGNGAGAYLAKGRLTHCTVWGNNITSSNIGDGAGLLVGSNAKVDNTLVVSNKMASGQCSGKGAVYLNGEIRNVTIVDNVEMKYGGGVYLGSGKMINTVIDRNALMKSYAQATTNWCGSSIEITASLCPEALPSGTGNVVGTLSDRGAYVPRPLWDGYRKGVYKDEMANETDLAGKRRATVGRRVDIGCYQSDPAGLSLIVR